MDSLENIDQIEEDFKITTDFKLGICAKCKNHKVIHTSKKVFPHLRYNYRMREYQPSGYPSTIPVVKNFCNEKFKAITKEIKSCKFYHPEEKIDNYLLAE